LEFGDVEYITKLDGAAGQTEADVSKTENKDGGVVCHNHMSAFIG
jgi:hypothetical protein